MVSYCWFLKACFFEKKDCQIISSCPKLVNIFSAQIKLQSTRWQFPIINCLDTNFLSLFMPDLIIPDNLSFNNFRTKTTRSWEIPRNEYTVQILVLFPTRKLQQENVWRIQKHSMGGRKTRIPVSFWRSIIESQFFQKTNGKNELNHNYYDSD